MEDKSQKRKEALNIYMLKEEIETLEELSENIDVSKATIWKFRQGEKVSRKTILKISKKIGIEATEIY